jgi:hypothetical protein
MRVLLGDPASARRNVALPRFVLRDMHHADLAETGVAMRLASKETNLGVECSWSCFVMG